MALNVVCVGLRTPRGSANVVVDKSISVEILKHRVSPDQGSEFYLCHGGSPLSDDDLISPSSGLLVLTAHYRVCGGKGGFGSLIRATGSHINRSSDKSACRDISGRRMRDIKKEKKIAEWVAAEGERKRERAEKRKRKLQKMMEEPKHKFEDSSYMEQIRSTEEGMEDSLKQGLSQAGPSGEGARGPAKKPKLWMQSDLEDLSDSDSEVEGELSPSVSSDGVPSTEDAASSSQLKEGDDACGGLPDHSAQDEASPSASTEQPSSEPSPDTEPPAEPSPDTEPPAVNVGDRTQSAQTPEKTGSVGEEAEPLEPVDLSQYSSVEDLASVGGERLKVSLQTLGLKCGGTPLERAQRLFRTKGKSLDQLPPSLFAKNKKRKR